MLGCMLQRCETLTAPSMQGKQAARDTSNASPGVALSRHSVADRHASARFKQRYHAIQIAKNAETLPQVRTAYLHSNAS
jgi:hypothetical protein